MSNPAELASTGAFSIERPLSGRMDFDAVAFLVRQLSGKWRS